MLRNLLASILIFTGASAMADDLNRPVTSGRPATETSPPASPDNSTRVLLQALSLLEAHEVDAAFAAAQPILNLRRDRGPDHLAAELQLRLGDLYDAKRSCQAGLSKNETGFGQCQLGRIYVALQMPALAVEHLERAEVLGHTSAKLHLALAAAYLDLGRPFGKVERVHFENASPGRNRESRYLIEATGSEPDVYLTSSRDSAIYHAQEALENGETGPAAQIMLARVFVETRRFDRAISILEFVTKQPEIRELTDDQRADLHALFARACFGADRVDDYVKHSRRAATAAPGRYDSTLAEVFENAARRFAQRGDVQRYIEHLELALNERPDSAQLHYLLGNAYWEAGRTAQAADYWRQTLTLEPQHPDRVRMLEHLQARQSAGRR